MLKLQTVCTMYILFCFSFVKKQGLTHLFYECDNHLWRLGKRPLQKGILYDGGSDWITLYRDFCEYSVSSQDSLVTGLKESYKYTLLPVEVGYVYYLRSAVCRGLCLLSSISCL